MIDGGKSNTPLDLTDVSFRQLLPENTISNVLRNVKFNRRLICNEIKHTDLVIAYMPSSIGVFAAKEARKRGKKVMLVSISCPWDALWNHSLKGKLMAPLMWWRTRCAFKKADFALYVTNEFLQRRYPSPGLCAGISDVVLNPVDNTVLTRRIDKIRNTHFNYTSELKLVTCAAVNVKYKRQEDVITAIAHLKDKYNLHYYLVGGGDPSRLKKIATKYGIANRVHFIGFVDHKNIFPLLESMDIYIQPSKQEGLPRSLVEAMSVAIPCIGSTTGGIPELLPRYSIFKRGNYKSLIDILQEHLNQHVLTDNAIYCFEKAKEYETETINHRRVNFFQSITEKINNEL